jgi:multidrug efflux pump subunit AcrA (membrane-fusion protein)
MLNPGDLAESGTGRKPILKIAQIDPLRVDIVLPGLLFGKVKPGARVNLSLQGGAMRQVGAVRMVDKVVDAASGTLVARVELPNPGGSIPGGVRCKAEFDPPLPGAGAVASSR